MDCAEVERVLASINADGDDPTGVAAIEHALTCGQHEAALEALRQRIPCQQEMAPRPEDIEEIFLHQLYQAVGHR